MSCSLLLELKASRATEGILFLERFPRARFETEWNIDKCIVTSILSSQPPHHTLPLLPSAGDKALCRAPRSLESALIAQLCFFPLIILSLYLTILTFFLWLDVFSPDCEILNRTILTFSHNLVFYFFLRFWVLTILPFFFQLWVFNRTILTFFSQFYVSIQIFFLQFSIYFSQSCNSDKKSELLDKTFICSSLMLSR